MRIISGTLKNRTIITPKGFATRPTSEKLRGAVFNICQGTIEGASFLDLFAGSGGMGLEAISRGAGKVVFIDNARASTRAIQENLQLMGVENQARVLCGDVVKWLATLQKQGEQFDFIYSDPPYEAQALWQNRKLPYGEVVLEIIGTSSLLTPGGLLFIEGAYENLQPLQVAGSLELINSRRVGRSILCLYKNIN
jgi:16S rRNA (guanine(966)-N(2))-methyltransferase RsmD